VRVPKGVAAAACENRWDWAARPRAHPASWRDDDYDVRKNGTVIGRIFSVPSAAPEDGARYGREIARAAHGFEATRETTI
jgi:hypothetical protein